MYFFYTLLWGCYKGRVVWIKKNIMDVLLSELKNREKTKSGVGRENQDIKKKSGTIYLYFNVALNTYGYTT